MNGLKELEKLRKKNLLEIYSLRYENERLRNEIERDKKDKRNRKLREKRYAAKKANFLFLRRTLRLCAVPTKLHKT